MKNRICWGEVKRVMLMLVRWVLGIGYEQVVGGGGVVVDKLRTL